MIGLTERGSQAKSREKISVARPSDSVNDARPGGASQKTLLLTPEEVFRWTVLIGA